jgi:DNA-binding PadR family transcriptional regulator
MTPSPSAQPLRPIEFEILLALADGDCHGYAIIQEVEARSDGKMRLETGTLYRALRRLVSDGYAKPTARRPHRDADDAHDERRRYYSITPAGRVAAAAEAARLARLVAAARSAGILTKPAKA